MVGHTFGSVVLASKGLGSNSLSWCRVGAYIVFTTPLDGFELLCLPVQSREGHSGGQRFGSATPPAAAVG